MPLSLTPIECPHCGAPIPWDGTYGKPVSCPYCGSVFMHGPSQVDDVWLMTDPVARARFEFKGSLDALEQDIRFEVLRGGTWNELDRECKRELERLERQGALRKLASFWALSPFPPVYRARRAGELFLGGQRFPFRQGEELVWACPMTRDRFDLQDPILIGNLDSERVLRLCGEMAQAMMGRLGAMEA